MFDLGENTRPEALDREEDQGREVGPLTRRKEDQDDEKALLDHIIGRTLCSIFPMEWLRKTAKETGLVKRERKIDPVIMFWVMVFSYGVQLQRTLASLKRSYEKNSDDTLSDSNWYERFTPEMVKFLRTCVMHGIEHLAKKANRKLSGRLNHFKDVLIQDSTVIRLHEKLAKK